MSDKKRILFVCSVNRLRSLTAEDHFSSIERLTSTHEFRSCGTDIDYIEYAKNSSLDGFERSVPISRELVDWADVILCMENRHATFIRHNYGDAARDKAYVLGIPDWYDYGSPELKRILDEKVQV